jgi:hypothetical protein
MVNEVLSRFHCMSAQDFPSSANQILGHAGNPARTSNSGLNGGGLDE